MVTLHFNDKTLKIHEDDSSYRYRALMEKPTLTLKFSMPEFIEIPVGAWCEYQGEIYTLNKPENFKKQGSRRLEYTLTLGDPSELLGEYKVRNNVDRRLKWSMCAKPREFVQIIVENLNQRAGGGWSVGECIDATEKTIEFNHTYCDAALQSVSEVFNTEWEIIGKVFHLRKVEYFKDDPLPLGYGKGNGFKPGVGRSTESGQKPVKRLYVQGGSRNIDRSKYGAPDLLLPKSQTLEYEGRVYKADVDGYFIERYDKISSARKEDSLDCSEIYPSRVGEVTSVVTVDAAKNWYDFVDNTIPANLNFNDYLIEGETATIVFQSGMLAGDDKQFEFKYDHEKRRFEIKPQEIDGVTMPNASYKPQAGDRYAVFGIMLPNEYIRNDADKSGASWDMFREAARYLYENEDPKFTFSGELQSLYTKKNWLRIGGRLKIGSYILFTDEQFAPDGVPIRIVGIKENLSSPYAPIITISNESHGTNITSKLNEISQNEVKIEESHNDAIRFTKRRFRDATETMSMLEDALLDNFTNSINPIAVRTMQMLVGDESLQFRFIQSRTSQTAVNLNITYSDETKQLNCPHGFLQHLTLGINTLAPSHQPNEYLVWEMNAYQSPQLTDGAKQYYLYARVHRTNTALVGSFLLSPTAIGMKQEANYYHLLVGVLNSEYDGERSFATLYGFTEILPGRVTTDKVVSADGNSFFDMLANAFKLGNKLRFNIDGDNKLVLNGTMVQSESGDEFPVPCYRGVWNARTTYYKGDLVSYNDGKGTSMYICIAPSYCTRRTPGGDGNAYWSLYASQGTNGDFTEYRYAVNGSKTVAPALSKNTRNPSGWGVEQPTLDTLQYMWRTYAKISGETNELLSEWATPVRVTPYDGVDGKPGKDGKSPVLVFCGKYDSKKTYYGNEHRLDAVKYGDTFYIARIDAGTFYDVAPDNTSKWNSFGASFESIATNLLLAEGANIGDWFIKAGQIVSTLDDTSNNRILMQVGRYSGNTFIYEPKIILECSSSSGDYMMPGESSRGAIITLDATRGTVEARSKTDYDVSYMSPSGIFANRAGTEAMSATTGRTFRASLVGLGRANVNKSEWSLDKLGTLVMGVYGSSYNSGNAMAVGGFFDKLYAHGLILHRMAISGENVTKYLNYNDTMVVGYTSDAATVYLPANPYEGQVIFVKQWWSGYMRFRPRTGHCIYDDHTENEYYDFGEGYAGMFVFSIGYVTSGNTTTKKEAWLVSRWKY